MKQKIVIKVALNGDKSRSKAMKTAVGVSGVESAGLGGDKSQIEVKGEGVDAVVLTTLLRKKCGYAELISVSVEGEKKEEEKEEDPKVQVHPSVWSYGVGHPVYDFRDSSHHPVYYHYNDPNSCSIM